MPRCLRSYGTNDNGHIGNRILKQADLISSFEFEALEQRVLLSADPVLSAGVPSGEDDPFAAVESLSEVEDSVSHSIDEGDSEGLYGGVIGEGLTGEEQTDSDSDQAEEVVTHDQNGAASDDVEAAVVGDLTEVGALSTQNFAGDDLISNFEDADVESVGDQLAASLVTGNGPPENPENKGNTQGLTVGSSDVSEDGGSLLSGNQADKVTEIEDGETLSGNNSYDGTVVNNGNVSPGNSPGIQTFADYTQTAGGTLTIEIGGTTAGSGYDQI